MTTNAEKWSAPPQPTNEATYEEMMRSLDQHLAEKDLHIFQRPMHAASHLAMAYGTTERIQMIPVPKMDEHPKYSAEYLVARAHQWYSDRYGDAVKTRPELGFFMVPLQHRVWKVRAPFFCGTAHVYIDRKLTPKPRENIISRGPVSINILDCFEGMTQSYADTLTDDEFELIETRFGMAFGAMTLLDVLDKGSPFYRQARIDYNHSVEALCSVDRSYGKARRDTATCAEKVMKGMLAQKGVPFEQNHNFGKLVRLLNDQYDLSIDLALVEKIHTKADVSYDKAVSKQEALDAHENLLRFLAALGKKIFS
ncbi:MAG: hypothetical protein KGJ32_14530 [Xanthomonadaceae bacterium]|nr:hypothetical protein [Xanthomonadaceae bacterium]